MVVYNVLYLILAKTGGMKKWRPSNERVLVSSSKGNRFCRYLVRSLLWSRFSVRDLLIAGISHEGASFALTLLSGLVMS